MKPKRNFRTAPNTLSRSAKKATAGISDAARLEARAKVLKALAHPTRLRIIEELSLGEQCVCSLQKIVGGDLSTVSKHLLVLKNAHLVAIEKRGLQVFYSLKAFCTIQFLDCIEDIVHNAAREHLCLLPDPVSHPNGSAKQKTISPTSSSDHSIIFNHKIRRKIC